MKNLLWKLQNHADMMYYDLAISAFQVHNVNFVILFTSFPGYVNIQVNLLTITWENIKKIQLFLGNILDKKLLGVIY